MTDINLSIGLPNWITVETEDSTYSKSFEGKNTFFNDIKLFFVKKNKHLDISIQANESKIKYLKLRWTTKLEKNIKVLGDEWERSYGNMGFQPIQPNRILPWYFLLKNEVNTSGVGVKVQPNAMCFWQVDPSGITLIMDLRNGGNGVDLDGRCLKIAEVVYESYAKVDSFAAAVSFCQLMCSKPLLPDQPVYGSNNWYYAYGDISEEQVIQDADYLKKITNKFDNPPFMVIDDGWQSNHRILDYNGGPWENGNKKFPNIKKLNTKIKAMGLRTGLWFRPLLNESSEFKKECRLKVQDTLDPTHPYVKEYLRKDIRRICNWGFEMIKHDFSTFDLFGRWGFEMNPFITKEGWNFYDRKLTNAEVVKNFYRLIMEECKPTSTLILGCNTIGHLGAGMMHLHRIGDDTSGISWERTRQIGINTLAFRLPQHNTFFHVDADCVGITGEIDWYYNKQWTEVVARSGTSLFISVKPDILSPDEFSEISNFMKLASNQLEHMVPLDWEFINCPDTWGENGKVITYDWYQKEGLEFIKNPIRYQSFLSIE